MWPYCVYIKLPCPVLSSFTLLVIRLSHFWGYCNGKPLIRLSSDLVVNSLSTDTLFKIFLCAGNHQMTQKSPMTQKYLVQHIIAQFDTIIPHATYISWHWHYHITSRFLSKIIFPMLSKRSPTKNPYISESYIIRTDLAIHLMSLYKVKFFSFFVKIMMSRICHKLYVCGVQQYNSCNF